MKVRAPSREELKKLVEGVGGPEPMRAMLEDFYERMSHDILIGYFFTGKNLKEIARKQSEFILNAAGFLERFDGKGPSSAHTELPPIWKGHFDRRLLILRETLTAHHVPTATIEQWIQFEEAFRAIVVEDE